MKCKKDQITENEGEKQEKEHEIPLMALNHVSRVCRSVKESVDFYTKILGFVLIERPEAFDFDGAWLFNYGVGIHLVQSENDKKLPQDRMNLDPKDNHISFQCENMEAMEQKLKDKNNKYIKRTVGDEEEGAIDQLFFNDPDGFMIEICNCENLKLVPQGSLGRIKLPFDRHNPPIELENKVGD
ncbi:Lactoylglutathione lyase/glyoxalase I family protein [Abeliophyllum distichum]|uniref:Lactoylglutathione lyase/glyoxalase I family protein n=1 Tax=Abeliophyllum distichum TaxID=126358 RepID=A0ABD1RTA9_9LAMI